MANITPNTSSPTVFLRFGVIWTLKKHTIQTVFTSGGTVDGRNPAPVEVNSLSHYLRRVLYIPDGARFLPSTDDWMSRDHRFSQGFPLEGSPAAAT